MAQQSTREAIALDKSHLWHPFTQHRDWNAPEHEPLVLVEGEGALLRDSEGREYIDGNSSIWTNLHGHRHPKIDAAIRAQLDRVAHTSFLGFTHPLAAELARELVALWPANTLTRVFLSDDGSTAVEVALKMAVQFWQQNGHPERTRFIAFSGAYHGDTMGASSLGGISTFHGRFSAWQFPAEHVASVGALDTLDSTTIAAVVIEPLMQGAAGMRLWPRGMLAELRRWCDEHGVLLILDEVMTGFGRTGKMFACEHEGVIPDFIALAKGLTGGYLPLAATLTSERIFNAFLGGPDRTLYYGHSYTANQLGCAAALASLAIFREERVLEQLAGKIDLLARLLGKPRGQRYVAEVRQCGFMAGVELRRTEQEAFPADQFIGAKVCLAARRHGLLTRPIRDTIVLMPPYCINEAQIGGMVSALATAIREVCGG
ncbi:aminotransferase class-III [Chthoniobacter flavus Ellin428]|uniref:Adenosylmethionine-8-amino-7-oxononanoate aminotransferase n=1 Tax=Chthoniobacter flavus Ellin428 TaxID=497964 RepID=B4CZE9_9BACT|nr:adenosylmethionine--8-amino-7-oxononanoate transaminase [Chthoniobacter flavus]EDY20113.1 aminotransferase class-III [Chthoniobacter flavus Ellin428]TCO94014.1 adenosylmethionine-8-amino-7-oxononanoate aminotransferase [Chthoniobacter flavus]